MKIRTKSKNKDQIRTSFSILVLIRTFDYNKDQCGNTANTQNKKVLTDLATATVCVLFRPKFERNNTHF